MYLKKTPNKNGRISLSAVHGFRDNGRVRQRTIMTFGFVDELEKQYPDPIKHFTNVVANMEAERKALESPLQLTIYPLQKIDKRTINRKCIGDAIPLAYYNSLGIESAVRSNMRGKNTKFDVNALLRLLVLERIVCPSSKYSAWERRDKHFYKCDISQSDLYRGLDEIARMSDAIVKKINTTISKVGIRDLSCGFYDCTNYYFESNEDELRRKGVSKEHRPNPIVQMGLMQDSNGIPISFNLFSGNTHDSDTLLDALPDTKDACDMGRVVIVADKGMNCKKNIIATIGRGDGFVFSQSIRGTKSTQELRDWVLDEKDYVTKDSGEFKLKAKLSNKTIKISKKDSYDGKAHNIDIPIQVVAFWSRKYAIRARREREKTLEKSRELVSNPYKYTRATHLGAAKYVRNVEFDEKTGEVVNNPKKAELDLEVIEADEACDGYYCIITSETSWKPSRVIDTYKELWRIEETFRITKTHLKTRPVYVWTEEHIKAHFLICYIALVLERLIEHGLGNRYSTGEILENIRAFECSKAEGQWWLLDYSSDLIDKLFDLIGEKTPNKWETTASIKSLFNKNKEVCWQYK